MSLAMPIQEFDQFGQKTDPHYFSDFSTFCRAAWKSADKMADDLSAFGIRRSKSTCVAYRNGSSEASTTLADAIYSVGEWRMDQEINERKQRIAQRRARRRA